MAHKDLQERIWSHNPYLITSGQTSMSVRTPANAFYDALEQYDEKQTREDQAALGERIQAGVRINKTLEYPEDFEGTDEEREVAHPVIADARAAREHLVMANLGLVSDFIQRFRKSGLTYDELLHVGVMGMMKGAMKFDPKKGAFSTIAYWWMHQTIVRDEENTVRRIRLPNNIDFAMRRVLAKRKENPGITDEEILEQVDIKQSDLEAATEAVKDVWALDLPVEPVAGTTEVLTFGGLVGVDEKGYDEVEADVLRSNDQAANLRSLLEPQFNGTSDKVAYVLVRRMLGLADFDVIARELNIQVEEVRSYNKRGLNYLRKLGEDAVTAAIDPAAYEAAHWAA